MFLPRFARARAPFVALVLIFAYVVSAMYSLEYMRAPNGKIAIYLSNAFLLSGLLLLRGPWRLVCLVGCAAGCTAVVYFRGFDLVYSIGTGVVAAIACLTGATIGRKVLPQPRLKNMGQAIKVLCLVIAPSAMVSGVLSSSWAAYHGNATVFPGAIFWFMASFTGTSMILPTLLMLATPSRAPALKRSQVENASLAMLVIGIFAAPFLGLYFLALMLAFPAANLFAMRLGGRATAVLLTVINLGAFSVPFLAQHSFLNQAAPEFSRIMVAALQLYAVVVFYNGVFTALTIDQHQRTRRQLERRTAMARAARAVALEASKAKTEFLATMSHEIRTPLNSILGFSQLLERRDDLASDARRQIGMIQRSGESLLTIVNDILDFSKVEAGKLTLDERPASLVRTAEEALAIAGPAAEEKGLSVSMAVEGEAEQRHLFDDHRVRQIMLNFLNNAVKFTDSGEIRVCVSLRPRADGCDVARLSVTDTGVGIGEAALPRLFQRFSQADSSISRSYGGTGLGLSICKGLAEAMGGRVGVDSAAGRGSTFWLELALPRVEGVDETAAGDEAQTALAAHVLLVDDNAANRELALTVLGILGCTADAARDGAEAIEAVKSRRYDLVLMDVHMPRMDGLAATRAIRALPGEMGKLPIIAMSADVLPEQVERTRAAGMVDHVAKPINVAALYACLQRWLADDAATDEVAAA